MNPLALDCLKIFAIGVLCVIATAGAFYALMTDPAFDHKPQPALTAPGDPPPWAENHGKRWAD